MDTKDRESSKSSKKPKAAKSGQPRIALTDEIVAQIETEIKRSGVYPHSFFEDFEYEGPLSIGKFWSWRNGAVRTVLQSDLDAFFATWASFPDCTRIRITAAQRSKMQSEVERTGIGPSALLRGTKRNRDSKLNSSMIKQWISGATETAERDHVEYVLKRWQGLPTKGEVITSVSDEHIAHVRAELARTGLSQPQLLRDREDTPKGLTWSVLMRFLQGKMHEFPKDYYDYILRVLREAPSDPSAKTKRANPRGYYKGRIGLTEDMSAALRLEKKRTAVPVRNLVRLMALDGKKPPPEMRIYAWMNGRTKSVPPAEYEMVLSAWRELPDTQ